MDDTTHGDGSSTDREHSAADQSEANSSSQQRFLSTREAAFIGVGAMVGAGIFALLGAAGEVAGAAVWLSFLLAGVVALLQGYSFGKLGARYPSAGGLLEYVAKGFGDGHFTGITAWLTFSANAIVTAMCAVSFGSYASALFGEQNAVSIKLFAALIIIVMTLVNIVGSQSGREGADSDRLYRAGHPHHFRGGHTRQHKPAAPGTVGYPPLQDIISSVALTFFAFLGFGIITFTAKDLATPLKAAAQGNVSRARNCNGHLHRHLAGCLRHAYS